MEVGASTYSVDRVLYRAAVWLSASVGRHVDRNFDGVMDHSALQRDDRTAHRVWARPFYEPPFGRRDFQ